MPDFLSFASDFIDNLEQVSGNWWYLFIIFGIALLDSMLPVVPSETALIIGGVSAGLGDQQLILVILAGAAGAFLGDNTAYLLGRRFRPLAENKLFAGNRRRHLERAERAIQRNAFTLLLTARFVPGGRTVMTVACGITQRPWGKFATAIAFAASAWAIYGASLGYFGGKAFEDNHTRAFVVAFAMALGISVAVHVVRHFWEKYVSKSADERNSEPTI